MSKSEFVRKYPFDMPAAEVVAAAKKAGIKLTSGLVNVVRTADRKKAREQGKPVPAGRRGRPKGSKAAPQTELDIPVPQEAVAEPKVKRRKRDPHDHALVVNGFAVRTAEERDLCELSLQIGFTRAAELLNGFRERCLGGLKS